MKVEWQQASFSAGIKLSCAMPWIPAPCSAFIAPVASAKLSNVPQTSTSPLRPVASLNVGELLFGVVAQVDESSNAWLDVGVATVTGKKVRARLRLRQKPPPKIGATLPVEVLRVNGPAARVEVWRPRPSSDLPLVRRLEDLVIGESLHGRVVSLGSSGAVVDVGVSRIGRRGYRIRCTGLLRRRNFDPKWVSPKDLLRKDDGSRLLEVGDELDLFVRENDVGSGRLFLDACPVSEKDVEEVRNRRSRLARKRHRRPPITALEVGSILKGTVGTIQKYGVFVDVGVKKDGLVHYSNMGSLNFQWKEVLREGMIVVVRVVFIEEERLSLEFLRLHGEEDQVEEGNKALERPSFDADPRDTPERIEQNIANVDESHSDDDEESVESEDGFDKFTDDYFESKYL